MQRTLATAFVVALILACEGRGVGVWAASINFGVGLPPDSLPPIVRSLRTLQATSAGNEVVRLGEAALDSLSRRGDTPRVVEVLVRECIVETRGSLGADADSATLQVRRELLAEKRARLGSTHPEVARSLINLASVHAYAHDDFATADSLTAEALSIGVAWYGTMRPEYARLLMRRGNLEHAAGRYVAAEDTLRMALAVMERGIPHDSSLIATCLANLSNNAFRLGDDEAAIEARRRALEIQVALHGERSRPAAITRHGYSIALGARDILAAYEESRRALEDLALYFDAGAPWRRAAELTHGVYLLAIGDDRAARAHLQRAVELEPSDRGERSGEASGWTWLGILELSEGRLPEAEANLARAVSLRRKLGAGGHPDLATSLEPYAVALSLQGKHDAAVAAIAEAREIQRRRTSSGRSNFLVTTLLIAAGIDEERGAFGEARAQVEEALQQGGDSPLDERFTWSARLALARIDAATGRRNEAFRAALKLEAESRELTERSVDELPERQALRYSAVREGGLELAVDLLLEPDGLDADATRQLFDAVIRSRASVLDVLGRSRNHRVRRGRSEDGRAWMEWDDARRRWNAFRLAPPEGLPAGEREARALRLRDQMEAAEVRVTKTRAAAFEAGRTNASIGIDDVDEALLPGMALIGYLRVRRPGSAVSYSVLTPRPSGTTQYVAFVQSSGVDRTRMIALGPAEVIDDAIREWSRAIGDRSAPVDANRERAMGDRVRRLIWDPLAGSLDRADRLFVVPDGAIAQINLSALPHGASSWMIESGPPITVLGAERDLLATHVQATGAPRRMLAVGGVSFDELPPPSVAWRLEASDDPVALAENASSSMYRGMVGTCDAFRDERFEPLPATELELREIMSSFRSVSDSLDLVTLRGLDASEGAFKAGASGVRAIHLATHGFTFQPDCPGALSSRGLASGPSLPGGEVLVLDNPLTRCGLALAGANRRAEAGPDEDDGLLTGDEIAALDLSGVEFVVLSACNSGVGDVLDGEGVLGLQRAFKIAGAGPVVMSLWPVEDQATRQWMRHFYAARLTPGVTTAEATRRASLAMLKERRRLGLSTRPSTWGAFVSVGVER